MTPSDLPPPLKREIARLIEGFRRFRERFFQQTATDPSIYQKLAASGQAPKTMLIGCSDSRVDPAILTDASPGEIFVVRNVANLVPPCEAASMGYHGTSAALEFAVETLKVENVIVLGHRQCGGVQALMRGITENKDSFIGQWMSIANEAKQTVHRCNGSATPDEQWRLAEMESIKISLRNVRSFPFVEAAIASRQLNLIGAYFDLEQGELSILDETTGLFRPLPM